jgi:hypothetical protein
METVFEQDLGSVRDYYCRPREVGGRPRTIYQIWEEGGACDDSVTPSTYCPEYQNHLALKLHAMADRRRTIYSIGCGNAVIEGHLVRQGHTVRAIDCNEEAVLLARDKQVDARVGDIMEIAAGELSQVGVVYADGLVGHLLDPETGLGHFFRKLRASGLRKETALLISNDAPRSAGAPFERHPRVKDFWFVSPDFLARSAEREGYTVLETYTFPYLRPQSGLRLRSVLVAKG